MENNKQGTFYIVSWEVPLQAAAMALFCTVCVSAAEDETIKLTVWGAEEDQNLLKELTDKYPLNA